MHFVHAGWASQGLPSRRSNARLLAPLPRWRHVACRPGQQRASEMPCRPDANRTPAPAGPMPPSWSKKYRIGDRQLPVTLPASPWQSAGRAGQFIPKIARSIATILPEIRRRISHSQASPAGVSCARNTICPPPLGHDAHSSACARQAQHFTLAAFCYCQACMPRATPFASRLTGRPILRYMPA